MARATEEWSKICREKEKTGHFSPQRRKDRHPKQRLHQTPKTPVGCSTEKPEEPAKSCKLAMLTLDFGQRGINLRQTAV